MLAYYVKQIGKIYITNIKGRNSCNTAGSLVKLQPGREMMEIMQCKRDKPYQQLLVV
jgi:hypothetical protein